MVKKCVKSADGKYHHKGKKFDMLIGSRPQVWHGKACKTPGGLFRDQLLMNKAGRIVSKKKHYTAKKEKRLEKAGYFTEKGKFGAVKKMGKRKTMKRKGKTSKRGKRRYMKSKSDKTIMKSIAKRLNLLKKRTQKRRR